MTKLEIANKFLFQFFFIRLTRNVYTEDLHQVHQLINFRFPGYKTPEKYQWYSFQGWIIPFSGWNNDFKFIGKVWNKGRWLYNKISQ